MSIELVLAIETSCDDTSVAIVDKAGLVRSLVCATKDFDHEPYGGIVPEIASRNHSLFLLPLIIQALEKAQLKWDSIGGIAVTNRPGLMGSLIVGVVTAKTLAQSFQKPLIGVNHLEGHLLAPFLKDTDYSPPENFNYPYVGLAVSGGHTSLYRIDGLGDYKILGRTKDDSAGEAFDKFAKVIGLGFPGGVKLDQLARSGHKGKGPGDPSAFDFPRSMIREDSFDMSFSGLKSSGKRLVETLSDEIIQDRLSDLCASYQEAIVDVLIAKLERSRQVLGLDHYIITGGVSANSRLRERAHDWAADHQVKIVIPPLRYCTDNAAMIGYAGILHMNQGKFSDQSLKPSAQSFIEDFKLLTGSSK